MWTTFAQVFVILVSSTKCNDIDVFSLAGIDEGQDKSYLKWNPAPGRQNFDALSLCMRWRKHRWKWFNAFEFDLWEDNCRFNPHLISESGRKPKSEEMVLASVMNDVGNGNKDEVILLLTVSFYNWFPSSFSSSSCPSAPSLLAKKTRMGDHLATFLPLLGVLTAMSEFWKIKKLGQFQV